MPIVYYYVEPAECISDYYNYILNLIRIISVEIGIQKDIVFTDDHIFQTHDRPMRIYYNFEHTLVKQFEGNTSFPVGVIIDESDSSPYLVRYDYKHMNDFDIVIDYSLPNMFNIKSCGIMDYIYDKMVYIAPSLYKYNSFASHNYRPYDTLTSFYNTEIPRRAELLRELRDEINRNHLNVFDCYGETLRQVYKKTKIMVNIRQTDIHHTFEELRALPALQCGVLVISETCPLTELIPYSDYIIWCPRNKIIETTRDVLNNYEHYRYEIFGKPKKIGLNDMNEINHGNLRNMMSKMDAVARHR